jgi:hypothetical protein
MILLETVRRDCHESRLFVTKEHYEGGEPGEFPFKAEVWRIDDEATVPVWTTLFSEPDISKVILETDWALFSIDTAHMRD